MVTSRFFKVSAFLAMALLMLGSIAQSGAQVSAAPLSAPVNQCNNDAASNAGGQGLACTVTVTNFVTSTGASTGTPSTITVTRCVGAAGPISAGAGTCATTTSTSASPVTQITQCDGVSNGGGGVLICTVTMTNNISGTVTPTPATVYQCIGSVITGTGAPGTCTPVNTPGVTSVTAATVGQCNGSGNGGTSVGFICTVSTGSTTTAGLPVNIDQCNGSTNGGGALTRCSATVNSVIVSAPTAAPVATATPIPTTTPVAVAAPTATPAPVTSLPSTSTSDQSGLVALLGLALAIIGAYIVRVRRTVPTKN